MKEFRAAIIRMHDNGVGNREIGRLLSISEATVRKAIHSELLGQFSHGVRFGRGVTPNHPLRALNILLAPSCFLPSPPRPPCPPVSWYRIMTFLTVASDMLRSRPISLFPTPLSCILIIAAQNSFIFTKFTII